MLKINMEDEELSHSRQKDNSSAEPLDIGQTSGNGKDESQAPQKGLIGWIRETLRGKSEASLRETIEEFIEEARSDDSDGNFDPVSEHEKLLISNILKLRDTTAFDVMVPRADIVAIDIDTKSDDLLKFISENTFTRIPVYRENLDNLLGAIHIKDILAALAKGKKPLVKDLMREVDIIAPSISVSDLMLQMRQTKKQIAMVIDEFGGIDGLVTISDVLEEIVGQIEDEHDFEEQPQILGDAQGGYIADARYELDEFEEEFGEILDEEEREDNDTLGGLIFDMAGRVPARGEVLTHSSGMMFEVLDAGPRRVTKLRITNIPEPSDDQDV